MSVFSLYEKFIFKKMFFKEETVFQIDFTVPANVPDDTFIRRNTFQTKI